MFFFICVWCCILKWELLYKSREKAKRKAKVKNIGGDQARGRGDQGYFDLYRDGDGDGDGRDDTTPVVNEKTIQMKWASQHPQIKRCLPCGTPNVNPTYRTASSI